MPEFPYGGQVWPCSNCGTENPGSSMVCSCGTERVIGPTKTRKNITDKLNGALEKQMLSGLRMNVSAPRGGAKVLSVPSDTQAPAASPVPSINTKNRVRVLPKELIKGATENDEDVKKEEESEFKDLKECGFIQMAGDDTSGRNIIVFSACKLPSKGTLDLERLLRYIRYILDKDVKKEYVIVYFHYGFKESYGRSVTWLKEAYKMFDKNHKKNLKVLYVVHPTAVTKFVFNLMKPFLSIKFGRKITKVNYLTELKDQGLSLGQLYIPQTVLDYDAKKVAAGKSDTKSGPLKTQQFGVRFQHIKDHSGRQIPIVVEETIQYLRANGLEEEGIFRKSASSTALTEVKEKYDQGESVDFSADWYGVHVPAVLLKKFLADLPEPILTYQLFEPVTRLTEMDSKEQVFEVERMLREDLPDDNYITLKYIVQFLKEVSTHSDVNMMTPENLGTVFGPNLLWSKEGDCEASTMGSVNSFAVLLIKHFDDLFKH